MAHRLLSRDTEVDSSWRRGSPLAGGGDGHGRSLEGAWVRRGVTAVAGATDRAACRNAVARARAGRAREDHPAVYRCGDRVLRGDAEPLAAGMVGGRPGSFLATGRRGQMGRTGGVAAERRPNFHV